VCSAGQLRGSSVSSPTRPSGLCGICSWTAEARPLTRFRRAVKNGNYFEADALGLLELIAEREPHRYERVALRWHGRLE
jgi:hypothetical protein